MAAELIAEVAALQQETISQLEFQLRMSGRHDHDNALLSIHAGAGGTESQDWAQC